MEVAAPPSPDLLYFSAPASPSRVAAVYREFESLSGGEARLSSATALDWEAMAASLGSDDEEEFAFEVSGHFEKAQLTAAEELFEEGKIRPLKPPPRQPPEEFASPKSPRRYTRDAFRERDRFADGAVRSAATARGRDRTPSTDGRKTARSHSPFRVSDFALHESGRCLKPTGGADPAPAKTGTRRWSLKDFLLFRSASEGRAATGRDPLRKFTLLPKPKSEDAKNSSFRSTESGGSVSRGRRNPRPSGPELHYAANRTAADEMKRKTFLPYRQGLLGCLGFRPALRELQKSFPTIPRV